MKTQLGKTWQITLALPLVFALRSQPLQAQQTIMNNMVPIQEYNDAEFFRVAPNYASNDCQGSGRVLDMSKTDTIFVQGENVAAWLEMCRENYSATSYAEYETIYYLQTIGQPAIPVQQCVGPCVTQITPSEPISPPYMPPPPCITNDTPCPATN